MEDETIWKVVCSNVKEPTYFKYFCDVKISIDISFQEWVVKPKIKIERDNYVAWRIPDGGLIEAYEILINTKPQHL